MTIADRLDAIHHVVHEYANFVSSGEMMTTGKHLGVPLVPPVNTHVVHAFLLNCRKMAEFFGDPKRKDDITAGRFVSTVDFQLPVFAKWLDPLDKQLAYINFARVSNAREIKRATQVVLYKELSNAWKLFYDNLPSVYKGRFDQEIDTKLHAEFRGLTLR